MPKEGGISDAQRAAAMRVLVVGGGIAGLTLAWWLRRRSHQVVVIERAPRLPGEGYMIDFFSSGYDVAERMKILPELERIHYPVASLAFISPDGRERMSLPYPLVRKRLFDNRHFNFMRGDLERVLHDQLDVAIRFGATVRSLSQEQAAVRVTFDDGSVDTFDLVVGADGVHSQVRRLAFGPEEDCSRYIGFHTAAFIVDDAELAELTKDRFQTLAVPGRQVGIYPIAGGRVATFFVHSSPEARVDGSADAARRELHDVYGGLRWVVPRLLDHLDRAEHVYFDVLEQVVLPRWHTGRVVLVGDASGCVSLLAGQGASMAMGGAYVLAEELDRDGGVDAALARYQERVRPYTEQKQRAARGIARWFVPRSRFRLALRNFVMRTAAGPLTSWLVRRQLSTQSVLDP